MHQVRFAKTDAAVNEERIIRGTRVLPDLRGSGFGELIALALYKGIERKGGVEAACDRRNARCLQLPYSAIASSCGRLPRADLQNRVKPALEKPVDFLEIVPLDPLDDKLIWCQQA